MTLAARIALCGNVFPADDAAAVRAALCGPVRDWAGRVRAGGGPACPGFGLYLTASAAAELRGSATALDGLAAALAVAGVECWTANAFPVGGFHGVRVKERAFLPDWTTEERARYTEDVAEVLARLAPPGAPLSISTCPLGYGPAARAATAARSQLLRARDACDRLTERRGAPVILALEPEPDGAFERAAELCGWLAELEGDRASPARRLGLCWDLCHGAVVGEAASAVRAALDATGTPLGKAQVSSALAHPTRADARALARLAEFAQDPYLHQVRASDRDGVSRAWRDLQEFLEDPASADSAELRVHCHVPIHHADFGDGWTGTPWRAEVGALRARGAALEVETYTLPVLPAAVRAGLSVPEILAQEFLACQAAAS
jgi:hypothetical protein